jgi:hypothetical protein
MFAAMGSCASINHIQNKSSACVEVLCRLAHEVTKWCGISDHHWRCTQVSIDADIKALFLDLATQNVHTFTSQRKVPPPIIKKTSTAMSAKPRNRKRRTTSVRDVLLEGMVMLTEKSMFEHWLQRTGQGGTDLYAAEPEEAAFDDLEGRMEVDTGMDPEFKGECPFSNADISAEDGSE